MTDSRLAKLTQARLKQLLHYDSITGLFTHIEVRRNNNLNKPVGSINSKGYTVIKLEGMSYSGHRLAWLYMTGQWPKDEVDHKDTVKHNNIWENLREANRYQNMQNRGVKQDSKTKVKGVKLTPDNTYIATIKFHNNIIHLGTFKTIDEAKASYINAANFYHGKFANYD